MKSLRLFPHQGRALLLALWLSGLVLVPFAARADTITIMRSGMPVPGGDTVGTANGGSSFTALPLMNDLGEVAYLVSLTGNTASNRAILRGAGGPITVLARKGDLSPDGVTAHNVLGQPSLNNQGHVVFYSTLASGETALHRLSSTNARVLVRSGEVAPGTVSEIVVPATTLIQFPPKPNALGHVAFDGVIPGSFEIILRADDFNLHPIAAYNGLNELGGNWRGLYTATSLNDSNEFAFGGQANYPSLSLRTAYFSGRVGEPITNYYAFQGTTEPGGDGQYQSGLYGLSAINQRGEFAIGKDLTGTSLGTTNNVVLYRGSITNPLVQISRRGDPAPDGVGRINFTGIFTPKINEAGQIAFASALAGPGVGTTNDSGIYVGSGGALTQIVRENQLAPTTTNTLAGRFDSFPSDFAFNDAGVVAFATTTQLRDVLLPFVSSIHGVFAGDGIELINVARTGNTFESTFIRGFGLGRNALNRHGQIAYLATLDGNSNIVRRWTPDLRWRFPTNGAWDAAQRWTLSLTPAAVHHVFIQPTNGVTVTGPTNDVTVRSLSLGNAVLQLQAGATLTATGGLFVATNTIFSGSGALVASFTNLGTISPGNSAGALAVTGDVTFATSSVFVAELGGTAPADFDRLHVQGNLSLNGALQLALINGHTLGAGQTYPILTASGTRTGQFNGLGEGALVGNFGGRDVFLTYTNGDGNDLALFTTGASNTLTLRIVSAHPPVLEFNAAAGLTYAVEGRENVATGLWSVVGTAPAGPARNEQVIDTNASTATKTYRLRTP